MCIASAGSGSAVKGRKEKRRSARRCLAARFGTWGCRYFAVHRPGKLFTGLFKRNLLKLTDFISQRERSPGESPRDYTLTKLARSGRALYRFLYCTLPGWAERACVCAAVQRMCTSTLHRRSLRAFATVLSRASPHMLAAAEALRVSIRRSTHTENSRE